MREEASPSGACDLILVALSAEPLIGWGRHLQGIRMRYAAMPLPMVVLVPERLKGMRLLRGMAQVISGRECLAQLEGKLQLILKGRGCSVNKSDECCCWLQAMRYLRQTSVFETPLKTSSHGEYYRRARLVKYVGVDHLHVLRLSGLLSYMTDWS